MAIFSSIHCSSFHKRQTALAAALCLLTWGQAWSQAQPEQVTITSPLPQQVSGFGDVAPGKAPFSAVSIDGATLRDIGATRLSDALHLDPSVADSYNSPAYWDMLSVRGFTLNNRYNYRREGLPINAETMIPMDNKERIELFKGTSGIQAGTSAPGGLVNYMVKRPPALDQDPIRSVSASYGPGKTSGAAIDLGGRWGQDQAWGYRLNAAYEDLNPYIRNTQGHRQLLSLAMDWRLSPTSKLEWEMESSQRQQMGVNAYSLLGSALPAPVNGTLNFTRQPWSVPGEFGALTGSLKFKQQLEGGWLWTTQYGAQRLRTDDRLTFAYGCSAENAWDRFCSNGSFDVYDFRSDNERRLSDALQTEMAGQLNWGGMQHDVAFSVMRHRQLDRLAPMQAYNWAGTGTVDGTGDSAASPIPGDLNTNRSEYATEWSLKDRIRFNTATSLWLGLRHTQISRSSARTDGSAAVQDVRTFNTPWLAATHQLTPAHLVYASYGEGIESEVVPNRLQYSNAGQGLPTLRSHQYEAGLKATGANSRWQVTYFDITRPQSNDTGACDGSVNSCVRQIDGQAHHRGLEVSSGMSQGAWTVDAAATWIRAVREKAVIDPSMNGQTALNVPQWSVRSQVQYRWSQVPGLRSVLRLNHEGERRVLEDGTVNLPAWTTLDLATHYSTKIHGTRTDWTLAIDNLTDRHYWRESPKQFGHYYLYPGAPRTVRIGMRMSF